AFAVPRRTLHHKSPTSHGHHKSRELLARAVVTCRGSARSRARTRVARSAHHCRALAGAVWKASPTKPPSPKQVPRAGNPGLVAAYGFDEASGSSVVDGSGNGHTGSFVNANRVAAGKFGGALQFNGTSSVVTVPDSASLRLSSGMTLEAWVDPTTINA